MFNLMWVAAYVISQREIECVKWLESRGMTAYVPLFKKWTKGRRGKLGREVERPVFSNYVFVALDRENQRWDLLKLAPGYIGTVKIDGWPAEIPDTDIGRMKVMEDLGEFNQENISAVILSEGMVVEVLVGPLENLFGKVLKCDAKNLSNYVVVNILGRNTKLPLSSLRVIGHIPQSGRPHSEAKKPSMRSR